MNKIEVIFELSENCLQIHTCPDTFTWEMQGRFLLFSDKEGKLVACYMADRVICVRRVMT